MSGVVTDLPDILEPPSYIHPPAFSEDFTTDGPINGVANADADNAPPDYSRNAAADERIVEAQPSAPRANETQTPRAEYHFTSARMELNFGPKKYPVKVPCYGWNQKVEGYALIKDFKAATKVTITLEGSCNTCVVERGMSVYNSSESLISETQTLWTRPDGASSPPTEPTQFPFSFPIPTYSPINPKIRLPHSYATSHVGLNADITYQVRVDLFRKGLRRHERLKTMILYLPRSAPSGLSSSNLEVPGIVEWETIPITPKYWQNVENHRHSKVLVPGNPNDTIKLILPLPKTYASAASIPFSLSLPSNSPSIAYISTHLSVQLIKYTTICAGGFISIREGIIGTGEIWRVEDSSYPTPPPSPTSDSVATPNPPTRKVYRGTLKSMREGGETSFNLPLFLEIKYTIRVRIRSPGRRGEGDPTAPEYYLDHPIVMCTHNRIPNAEDLHDPVIGLIAVPGSEGASPRYTSPRSGAIGAFAT